jgi:hypothetical protein
MLVPERELEPNASYTIEALGLAALRCRRRERRPQRF